VYSITRSCWASRLQRSTEPYAAGGPLASSVWRVAMRRSPAGTVGLKARTSRSLEVCSAGSPVTARASMGAALWSWRL
jgi:hypothetical protein